MRPRDQVQNFYARVAKLEPYFDNARSVLLGVLIATLVVALTEPAIPALLHALLDKGFAEKSLALWKVPVFVVGLFIVRGLAGFLAQYFLAILSNNAMLKLRTALFDKLQRTTIDELSKDSASTLSNTIIYEIQNGVAQLVNSLLSILKNGLTLLALYFYLLYLNWQLTLVVFTIIPGIAWIMKYFSKRLGRLAIAAQKTTDELAYVVEENALAQRMVRLHAAQAMQATRFGRFSATLRRLSIKSILGAAAMTPLTQILAAVALSAVICIALWQNQAENSISVGSFAAFITAMLMLVAPIKHLSEAVGPLVRGLAATQRGIDFIDASTEETTGAMSAPVEPLGDEVLRFDNVQLQYRDASDWALRGVSLVIKRSQKVALIGPSGSGKSSLMNLLPRFLEPTAGHIYIDGQELRQWDLGVLRQQFAYVSQDVVMFNDTLATNVALGDPTPDLEKVQQALRAAQLEEFVSTLALNIHTLVGHNAAQLSGGQRQRLAIARAVYKNSPILLLDEATSALDNESERAVQEALDKLMQGRTTLIVAHRLSTVQSADCIVVMSHGKIIEMGTHQTLLAQNSHYKRLYEIGL